MNDKMWFKRDEDYPGEFEDIQAREFKTGLMGVGAGAAVIALWALVVWIF